MLQAEMTFFKVFIGLLFMIVAVAASPFGEKECDFSGIDLDEEVDKLLEKFPKSQLDSKKRGYRPLFEGLEIGDVTVTGMNEMKRYGPVIPYCTKDKAFVQVDIINLGDVEYTIPWRSCSGQEGKALLSAEFSRFTAQLLVDTQETSGKYLALSDEPAVPVITYSVDFQLDGMGDFGRIGSKVLSKLFPTMFLELWTEAFYSTFEKTLKTTLQKNNEVF
uniref:Secreted protein n=1 Tax=Amblyomma maculatum TaxID=34609 RepID=G3MNV9_AMBMU